MLNSAPFCDETTGVPLLNVRASASWLGVKPRIKIRSEAEFV